MKTNSIYEALNNVDDKFISEAAKAHGKRPMALMITAASLAAALALAVGIRNLSGTMGNYISPADSPVNQSGASYVAPGFGESKLLWIYDSFNNRKGEFTSDAYEAQGLGKSEMSLPNDSADDQNGEFTLDADGNFWFNVYPHDIVIPDSFKLDETGELRWFRDLEMSPADLFAEFGVSPLMNDNFTNSGGEPSVMVSQSTIDFFYTLYNKNINKNVYFDVSYHTHDIGGAYIIGDNKVISMKDGHGGIVEQNRAFFAYDGVMYVVSVCGTLGDENDYIMDVLADLGVL
ncbi:MAG: hypothetical protein K2N06_00225 [Oscillospiraceae bacterium]|nr:hypothetical protein [Oscillospiraceae bacterium]